MEWNSGRVLAIVFSIEGAWMVVRAVVSVANGLPFSSTLSFGLFLFGVLLWPGSFFGAAWFLWQTEPPTLLHAAIARTLTVAVASVTTFLVGYAAASGHLTLL